MSYSNYLSVPVMAVLVVVQTVVLPELRLFRIAPQLLFLVVLAWGLTSGLADALIWALVAGFFVDLFSVAPLGVTSLAAMAGVSAAAYAYRSFPDSRLIMPAVVTALGTIVFWMVYLLLLRIIVPSWVGSLEFLGIAQITEGTSAPGLMSTIAQGYGLNRATVQLALEMALVHAILILPLLWLIRAIKRWTSPRQVEI